LIDILVKPGSHFKFGPLEKIADIFGRDLGAKFFRNGLWNSILPSNLASRRVVTELGYIYDYTIIGSKLCTEQYLQCMYETRISVIVLKLTMHACRTIHGMYHLII